MLQLTRWMQAMWHQDNTVLCQGHWTEKNWLVTLVWCEKNANVLCYQTNENKGCCVLIHIWRGFREQSHKLWGWATTYEIIHLCRRDLSHSRPPRASASDGKIILAPEMTTVDCKDRNSFNSRVRQLVVGQNKNTVKPSCWWSCMWF